jgi:hypothetical protein
MGSRRRAKILILAFTLLPGLASFLHPIHAAGRTGSVRLEERAMADDDGPFLALGATLFWGLWGEQHEPERLDRNLAWLAERGVDYVRILGMVGGVSWEDREVDPAGANYWSTVDRFLDRLARHGLRAQVTLFAEADAMMSDPDERQAFARRWANLAERRRERILLLEVANEHWRNGLDDVQELRRLGRQVANRTRTLVALSAPRSTQICDVYEDSAADIATIHYARSRESWTSVKQPWEWRRQALACRDSLPVPVNNEPVGPQSSVEADDDPARLVMSYVTTFLAGNAAYVLHAGAGVRGGGAADRALGRAVDFADTPQLDLTFNRIARAREHLPSDLPNWTRREVDDREVPFRHFDRAIDNRSAAAIYAATSGNRFVIAVLDARGPVSADVDASMTLEVFDPVKGEIVRSQRLEPGETLQLKGSEAFILTGRIR